MAASASEEMDTFQNLRVDYHQTPLMAPRRASVAPPSDKFAALLQQASTGVSLNAVTAVHLRSLGVDAASVGRVRQPLQPSAALLQYAGTALRIIGPKTASYLYSLCTICVATDAAAL